MQTLFIANMNIAIQIFKSRERAFFNALLMFVCRNITTGHKDGIGRMIMCTVKLFEFLIT